jgi:porphobilinogen synthase
MKKQHANISDRPRRIRKNDSIRRLVRETHLTKDDFIYPLFVRDGKNLKSEISSMPGIYHFSTDSILYEIEEMLKIGLDRTILFGIPTKKDELGSDTISDNGIIQRTAREIKARFPEMYLISDVCMCEYTSHGHCGIIIDNEVHNDTTLVYLQKQALSHVQAGVDMVAPSGMMDGIIGSIRGYLDDANYQDTPIMSYAVKYSSEFYGPFRDAAESKPAFGNRKQYQMDPANSLEALKEVDLDISEGADIIMIKPAMAYMDIIAKVRDISTLPIAAYNVSGEYSMIKAASEKGWINESKVRDELLTSIKRAGADIIITYFAKDFVKNKTF